jgi:hypothetical protein
MLLAALERRLRGSGKTESLQIPNKLTVEHLLPRKWKEHYPLPPGVDPREAEAQRERLVHSLGNLTMATGKLNPDLSNGPWATKREKLLRHSVLLLNADVALRDEWNDATIRDRGERLADLACSVWPVPS